MNIATFLLLDHKVLVFAIAAHVVMLDHIRAATLCFLINLAAGSFFHGREEQSK